jgi:hypothetical protein
MEVLAMTVKEKVNPCTQAGACVRVPNGSRAYVMGVDPKDVSRVLIEYESKGMGTDSYPPRSLTLVQAAPEAPQMEPAKSGWLRQFKIGDRVALTWKADCLEKPMGVLKGDRGTVEETKPYQAGQVVRTQYKVHLDRGGWQWLLPEFLLPAKEKNPDLPDLKATTAQAVKLRKALNSTVGATERWQRRWETGLSDEALKAAICQEFGIWGGSGGLSYGSGEKGDRPKFWDHNAAPSKKPTLEGQELIDAVRRLLAIPQKKSAERSVRQSKTATEIAVQPAIKLGYLAGEINRLHRECEDALNVARSAENSALQHAKLCGEKLLEAKQACGHGNWETWRAANLQIPSSTAALYQRVAERWAELESATSAADLTLREAEQRLRKPRQGVSNKERLDRHTAQVTAILGDPQLTADQPDFRQAEGREVTNTSPPVATQPALEPEATADPALLPEVSPAPQTAASCRNCRHRHLVADGSEFVCSAGLFRDFRAVRDDWGKANGCDSFSLPRADKPVVNARECRFTLHGQPQRGQISRVLIDWTALTVRAVVIDHDSGQVQLPVSQVQIFQEETR